MSSNKIIAQLSNKNDILPNDNVSVSDIDGVIKLINKGNVLIKFYSAECYHCNEMVPSWTELINMKGSNNKNQPAIISIESEFLRNQKITALLSNLNIQVSGFPTIVFVSHNKSVIAYEGARTAHDINTFINTQSIGIKRGHISKRKHTRVSNKKYTRKLRKSTRRNKSKRGGCACGM